MCHYYESGKKCNEIERRFWCLIGLIIVVIVSSFPFHFIVAVKMLFKNLILWFLDCEKFHQFNGTTDAATVMQIIWYFWARFILICWRVSVTSSDCQLNYIQNVTKCVNLVCSFVLIGQINCNLISNFGLVWIISFDSKVNWDFRLSTIQNDVTNSCS
jgi:hypothetical protein